MTCNTVVDYYPASQLLYSSVTPVMGTRLELLFAGKEEDEAKLIWNEVFNEIFRLEKIMSRHDPASELFALNSQAIHSPTKVSDELWDILQECRKYYQLTLGLFDISLSNLNKVFLNETDRTVLFKEQDVRLDLGGYGKGYALRRINNILRSRDIDTALVNFGNSSVLAIGAHLYGDYWPVGISHPATGETLGSVCLKDNSMSTSGNTPSHPQHILNPHTGNYYKGKEIITILSPDPVDAEALSTSLLIADEEQRQTILSCFHIDGFKVFEI